MILLLTVAFGRAAPLRPPVFVVGCGHSGTTILSQLLASFDETLSVPSKASEFYGVYESGLFIRNFSWSLREAQMKAWDSLALAQNKSVWIEKTPKHVHYAEEIKAMIAGAKFIVAFRNGLAVVASLVQRGFSFEASLKRWEIDNRAALQILENYPGSSIAVCYEDFIEPDLVVQRLCAFVGIKNCISFAELDARRVAHGRLLFEQHFGNPVFETPNGHGPSHDLLRFVQMTQPFHLSTGNVSSLSEEQKCRVFAEQQKIRWEYLRCLSDQKVTQSLQHDPCEADEKAFVVDR
jgi:hypothetical protein